LLAASLHYFRRSPDAFLPALKALRSLGADAVETPVPWSAHEAPGGTFRFDRDAAHLVAFLEETARAGLAAHLRLGPCVGADLTWLGLSPAAATDRTTAARHPDGSPQVVPVPPRWMLAPSYASRAWRERTRAWIAAVCQAVQPFLAPAGPVRSLILGDVWPFLGRNPAATPDHHPDACAAWQAARAALGDAERSRMMPGELPGAGGPDDAAPAGIGACAFAERLYVDLLEDLARAATGVLGADARFATTMPSSGLFAPVGPGLLARAFDVVGLDGYGWRERPAALERDALLLSGSARFPFASLVPVGTPPYLPHLSAEDQWHALHVALAAGLRGLVLSMGVGRDRWIGGLVDETLREDEIAHRHRRLLHGLARISWLDLRRHPRAALLVPRAYVRGALAAAGDLIGPLSPGLVSFLGFPPPAALDAADESPGGGAWWRWFEAAERSLQEAGVPYVLVDDESPETAEADLLVAPTLAECPRTVAERVRRQLEHGGRVLLGPVVPARDLATGEPLVPWPGGVRPVGKPDAAAVAAALPAARDSSRRRAAGVPGHLERAPFVDAGGRVRGLALVNRSRRDVPLGPAAGDGDWRDVDEPGAARAGGAVAAGEIRLLVPAGPREGTA
jgi:hypothetical protein